jgi:dTDP-glucose 4,6-dehydratase
MRTVVTGGAGFLGSHLCEALIARGDEVVCVDNFSTGQLSNIEGLLSHPKFVMIRGDVATGLSVDGSFDALAHLACPASPADYLAMPLETMAVSSAGTWSALDLADRRGARFVLASTSEIYGEPLNHPQHEEDWGNVNPIGPRSVYDESKRFSEALVAAYVRTKGTNAGIVRIFNTYGPRLRPNDGRVISTFIAQALAGEPLSVFGNGSQTRSFCYVDDLVRGLLAMIDSRHVGPINLGNDEELNVGALAQAVVDLTGSTSSVVRCSLPQGDPTRRRPDLSRAAELLGWRPEVSLEVGLMRTIEWQRSRPQVQNERRSEDRDTAIALSRA